MAVTIRDARKAIWRATRRLFYSHELQQADEKVQSSLRERSEPGALAAP
ncbi:MAG TPA: hypothetical protein VLK65_04770 [Vicinamibacteria bacterium]|nr:hypothetical protein [Vicinamibacteria bacterium]